MAYHSQPCSLRGWMATSAFWWLFVVTLARNVCGMKFLQAVGLGPSLGAPVADFDRSWQLDSFQMIFCPEIICLLFIHPWFGREGLKTECWVGMPLVGSASFDVGVSVGFWASGLCMQHMLGLFGVYSVYVFNAHQLVFLLPVGRNDPIDPLVESFLWSSANCWTSSSSCVLACCYWPVLTVEAAELGLRMVLERVLNMT